VLRTLRGWTQEELTAKAGCGKSSVERAEDDKAISENVCKEILDALVRGLNTPSSISAAWPAVRPRIIRDELSRLANSLPVLPLTCGAFYEQIFANQSFESRVPHQIARSRLAIERSVSATIGLGYQPLRKYCPDEISVAFSAPFVLIHAAFAAIARENDIRVNGLYEHIHNGVLVRKLIGQYFNPLPDLLIIGDAPLVALLQSPVIQEYELLGPAYQVEMALIGPKSTNRSLLKNTFVLDLEAMTAQIWEFERMRRDAGGRSVKNDHVQTHAALGLLLSQGCSDIVMPLWAPNFRAYEAFGAARQLQPLIPGPAVILVKKTFGLKMRDFLYNAFVDQVLKIKTNEEAMRFACQSILLDLRYLEVLDRTLGFGLS
jgi:transcriptional regulator with XRE-family HTH domain